MHRVVVILLAVHPGAGRRLVGILGLEISVDCSFTCGGVVMEYRMPVSARVLQDKEPKERLAMMRGVGVPDRPVGSKLVDVWVDWVRRDVVFVFEVPDTGK